jgi:alanyl-tRNA synthetase
VARCSRRDRSLFVGASAGARNSRQLQGECKSLQKTIRSQQEALAGHEARHLVDRAEPLGARRIVVDALDGWDATGLKAMAAAATAIAPTLAVALFSRSKPTVVVVAAGADTGVDANAVLKGLTTAFGGKGGGRRELAQGGGFAAPPDQLIAHVRAAFGADS